MLKILDQVIKDLPSLMADKGIWETKVINRRKPATYRAYCDYGQYRVCLHRFETCDEHEAFYHPHPWAGAFKILHGSYEMNVGYSKDRFSDPEHVCKTVMVPGSSYEILSPLTWHTVRPLSEVYTVMVNDTPWAPDVAHTQVRTTKGKDLASMTQEELEAHFAAFKTLTSDFPQQFDN